MKGLGDLIILLSTMFEQLITFIATFGTLFVIYIINATLLQGEVLTEITGLYRIFLYFFNVFVG